MATTSPSAFMLERAIFTSPPRADFASVAMIGRDDRRPSTRMKSRSAGRALRLEGPPVQAEHGGRQRILRRFVQADEARRDLEQMLWQQ